MTIVISDRKEQRKKQVQPIVQYDKLYILFYSL